MEFYLQLTTISWLSIKGDVVVLETKKAVVKPVEATTFSLTELVDGLVGLLTWPTTIAWVRQEEV